MAFLLLTTSALASMTFNHCIFNHFILLLFLYFASMCWRRGYLNVFPLSKNIIIICLSSSQSILISIGGHNCLSTKLFHAVYSIISFLRLFRCHQIFIWSLTIHLRLRRVWDFQVIFIWWSIIIVFNFSSQLTVFPTMLNWQGILRTVHSISEFPVYTWCGK